MACGQRQHYPRLQEVGELLILWAISQNQGHVTLKSRVNQQNGNRFNQIWYINMDLKKIYYIREIWIMRES